MRSIVWFDRRRAEANSKGCARRARRAPGCCREALVYIRSTLLPNFRAEVAAVLERQRQSLYALHLACPLPSMCPGVEKCNYSRYDRGSRLFKQLVRHTTHRLGSPIGLRPSALGYTSSKNGSEANGLIVLLFFSNKGKKRATKLLGLCKCLNQSSLWF